MLMYSNIRTAGPEWRRAVSSHELGHQLQLQLAVLDRFQRVGIEPLQNRVQPTNLHASPHVWLPGGGGICILRNLGTQTEQDRPLRPATSVNRERVVSTLLLCPQCDLS